MFCYMAGTRATLSADYIGKVLKLSIPGCRILEFFKVYIYIELVQVKHILIEITVEVC